MTAATETRRWTAVLTLNQGGRTVVVLPADPSRWDLVRDMAQSALGEAAEYVRQGLADEVHVAIHKTTKARGTEYDRPGGCAWRDGSRVEVTR